MRNTQRLPTIQNVTAGGHAVLNCPLGMSYDFIQFKLGNCTAADLKNFKVKVGSRTHVECDSAQLLEDLNAFYGRDNQSGYFTLWFYRPEMATEEERALTVMGTADIPSLTIEFDIDAGVANPTIEAHAVQRGAQVMGLITKIKTYPVTFATAGRQDIDNIPRGARISAFHLMKSDVSEVELEINNGTGAGKIVEASKGLLEAIQKQHGRTPVTAKMTHIDMNLLGLIGGPMPTRQLQDMRLKPVIDTSGALTTVVEYIDGHNGI